METDIYSKSGLFCCISNARDQMKSDEEVDIYHIGLKLLVHCTTTGVYNQFRFRRLNMATGKVIWGRGVLLILFIVYQGIRSEQNVALFKPSEQSTNQGRPELVASKVVDDCLDREMDNGCCTFTAGNWPTTAWWRVDMGELMTINSITITYTSTGERRDRLAGYHLYVSNTTSTPQDGTLCYVDTSSTIDEVQLVVTHQCPFVGRYVTVYNYRTEPWRQNWYYEFAILELCEVQVWGCPSGKFAEDCATSCPSVCYGGNCNSPTGACFYCFTGTYGDFCNLTCPGNCKDNVCEKDTGTCADCIPTTYGIRCELDCSTNCLDRLCDKDNGYCYDCIPMKYGPRCEQKCSTNCLNSLCDKDNGDCSACVPGKHGVICELNCPSNCMDGLCGKDTGHCLGCIPGTYGDTCEQQCPLNCKDSVCGKDTGYCIGCIAGKYGDICDQDCPENCKNKLCGKDTGHCIECIAGKHGEICDKNCHGNCKDMLCGKDTGHCIGCIVGRYGESCSLTCPVTCKDFECDQQTGHCLECYPAKYGVVCGADCPDSCKDNICNKDNGHCFTTDIDHSNQITVAVLAAICGLLFAAFTTALVVILCLRRRLQRYNAANKTTELSITEPGYTSISHDQGETPHVYEMVVN